MQYLGSKRRIAKYILPVMLSVRSSRQTWVEPFVGGANIIDKVHGKRMGNDINKYLIALFKSICMGWCPPKKITKKEYEEIRNNKSKYPDALVGFVGFCCSFGGKWWGGYARKVTRNPTYSYAASGSNSLVRQSKLLRGVVFTCGDYYNMAIPSDSLIYCDPPYENTTKYSNPFDSNRFWRWCREKIYEGHLLFVSEYSAPEDFLPVVTVPAMSKIKKSTYQPRTERLFAHKKTVERFELQEVAQKTLWAI